MKRISGLILLIVFFLILPVFFGQAQETLTIATYYPSPHGVYQELKAQRMAVGETYYDSTYCWPPAICTNLIDTNADLVVEGNVGIGTNSPRAKLDVVGEVKVGNTGLVCNSTTGGAVRYNSNKLEYCDGSTSTWKAASTTQIKTGTYTGDSGCAITAVSGGCHDWRTIDVGFQPKIVIILPLREDVTYYYIDNPVFKISDWPTTSPLFLNYVKDAEGFDNNGPAWERAEGINLLPDGFKVSSLWNINGDLFSWIAMTW